MRATVVALVALLVLSLPAIVDAQEKVKPLTKGELEKLVTVGVAEDTIVNLILVRGTQLAPGELEALRATVPARVVRAIAARGPGSSAPIKKGEIQKLVDLKVPGEIVAELIRLRGSGCSPEDVAELEGKVPPSVHAALVGPPPAAAPAPATEKFGVAEVTILGKTVRLGLPPRWTSQSTGFDAAKNAPATIALAPPQQGEDAGALVGIYVLPARGLADDARVRGLLLDLAKRTGLGAAVDAGGRPRFAPGICAGFDTLELEATGRDAKGDWRALVACVRMSDWLVFVLERARASRWSAFETEARLALQVLAVQGVKPRYERLAIRPVVLDPPATPTRPLARTYWYVRWNGHELSVEGLAFSPEGFVHDGLPPADRSFDPRRIAAWKPDRVGTYRTTPDGKVIVRMPGQRNEEAYQIAGNELVKENERWMDAERDLGRFVLQGAFSASSYYSSSTPTYDGSGGQQVFTAGGKTTYSFTRDGRFEKTGSFATFFSQDVGSHSFRSGAASKDGKLRGRWSYAKGKITFTLDDGTTSTRWFLVKDRFGAEGPECFNLDDAVYLKD